LVSICCGVASYYSISSNYQPNKHDLKAKEDEWTLKIMKKPQIQNETPFSARFGQSLREHGSNNQFNQDAAKSRGAC
jgi:hypothetical protein